MLNLDLRELNLVECELEQVGSTGVGLNLCSGKVGILV